MPKAPFVGILLLAPLLLGACGQVSPEEHFERARALYQDGNFRGATLELKSVLQAQPDNAEARRLLGELHLEVENGGGAEKELRRAVDLGVPESEVAIPLARALLLQSKFKELADEAMAAAASGGPSVEGAPDAQRAELLALQGHAYFGLGSLDAAEGLYDRALALAPASGQARLGEARLLAARGKVDEAKQAIEATLEQSPDLTEGWRFLGAIERYQENAAGAELAYTRAIESGSYDPEDWLHRALVRIALEDYEEAGADIAAVEQRVQGTAGAHYARGLIAFRREAYEEAQKHFQNALSANSGYLPAVLYAGLTNAILGQLEQAEQQLQRYLGANPRSDVAAKALAAVYARTGDYAGVEQVLTPVLARSPSDPLVLEMLGDAALRGERAQEGVAHFRKVIAQQADSTRAHLKLGLGMIAAGEEDEGVKALEEAAGLATVEDPTPEYVLFVQHLRGGRPVKALEIADQLRAERPEDPLPLNLRGVALMTQGEEAAAMKAFEESLDLRPGFPPAIRNLAALALRDGELDEAKSLYRRGLEENPDHTALHVGLAMLEARTGNLEQARKLLEAAVDRRPEAAQPRILLARYYTRLGQPERAQPLLQPLEETHGGQPAYLIEKGTAELEAGKPAAAEQTFQTLVELTPESAGAHFMLAKAAAGLGNADRVATELEQALSLQPNHFLANLAYARLLLTQGDLDAARERMETLKAESAADDGQLAELKTVEGELALRSGDVQGAVTAYETAFSAFPSTRLAVVLARLQLLARDQEAATATLEQWARSHPQDAVVRQALGELYQAQGREDEALEVFRQVLKIDPDNVAALNNSAWLLRKADPARAREFIDRALERVEGSATVLDTAGVVYLNLGESGRAVGFLDQAVRKAPDDGTMRFHLVKALVADGSRARAERHLKELLSQDGAFRQQAEVRALAQELGVAP